MTNHAMSHRIVRMLMLAGCVGFSTLGIASPAHAEQEPNTGRLSLDASLDFTNKYYFRGILQEDRGLIVQPGVELGLNLYEGEDFITSFDVYAGIWNSIHTERTGAMPGATVGSWYEADIYAGAEVTMVDALTVGTVFTIYTSPNSAFDTINEIAFYAEYDDSGLWEEVDWFVGFNPGALIAVELHNNAFGPDRGIYLELGITPTFMFFSEGPLAELEISTPIVLGMSLDDYYDSGTAHDTFGYVSAGIWGAIPLPMPADFGQWTLRGGVDFLVLGSELKTANSDDALEVIGTIGLSVSY